ncbi:DNA polymerase III subunit chi [Paucibacter soli]|uniref:DNA polymerase III subunit chi n=1 Tax=Paucibacter soli TaxID=3133433 RepID=UPI0030AADFFD
MAEVSFYTNVADRLPYVCRLLRKAQLSGAHVGVLGPAAMLERLDAALWTFEPTEFVPHVRVADAPLAAPMLHTPVVLAERVELIPHRHMLLNLGVDLPPSFDAFERVLEVVSRDEQQVQAGRMRFKRYRELGCQVAHHVVSD